MRLSLELAAAAKRAAMLQLDERERNETISFEILHNIHAILIAAKILRAANLAVHHIFAYLADCLTA